MLRKTGMNLLRDLFKDDKMIPCAFVCLIHQVSHTSGGFFTV